MRIDLMSYNEKLFKYARALSRPDQLLKKHRYVFVLSHMRARTSLLSHILGTHVDICGYRELHLSYNSQISLLKMKVALFEEEKFRKSKYLLDKLLHNRLNLCNSIFNDHKIYLVMMLRPPLATLSSMAKMHELLCGNQHIRHLVTYYENRLERLCKISKEFKGQYLYIDADEIVSNSHPLLIKLTSFLELESQLKSEYEIFRDTGVAGKGDFSPNIKTGRIVMTQNEPNFPLNKRNVKDSEIVYKRAREQLILNSHESFHF